MTVSVLRRYGRSALPGLAVVAIALALWEAGSEAGWISRFAAPPPSELLQSAMSLWRDGFPRGYTLGAHLVETLYRVYLGFLVGAALAIPAGIVISSKRWIEESMAYVVVFFRSLAPISILPVLIAIFGIGELSKIALIAFTCFWIVLTAVLTGMASVDASLLRAARSLDTNGPALRWRVMLPAALPTIFAGLRVALGIAFMVIVAAEMVATVRGLGALIQEARGSFRADITMVGMAVIGLIGWLSSLVLGAFERWLVPWGGVARGGPEA